MAPHAFNANCGPGGLSFGATVALELLHHGWAPKAEAVVLLDPRNLQKAAVALGRDPLWYEEISANLGLPEVSLPCLHVVAQVKESYESEVKQKASAGFQRDHEVMQRLQQVFQRISSVRTEADHFEFMFGDAGERLAHEIAAWRTEHHMPENSSHPPLRTPATQETFRIASMSCRFPCLGGSFDMFEGVDAVRKIPSSRLDLEGYDCAFDDFENPVYTTHAGCVTGVEWFAHHEFRIKAAEARAMDPQQRLLLEQGQLALVGVGDWRDHNVGVWIGQANHDWMTWQGWRNVSSHSAGGASPSICANRLNYVFDLRGPSVAVDTACSSSMVALCQATDTLRLQRCSMAVVGGTHVFADEGMFVAACKTTALSKVGRCLTLDASADGYCRGEGVGALILQPSADAKVAEILSVANNHDGRSASLTAPNGKAQERLFRTSLALASLQTVDVVELHGTGTKLGDPLEAASTMAVFGKSGKPVCGAVKSNMGHLEGSAGLAGLFKLICTLRNKAGPPNLHLKCLNQHISSDIIVSEACADLRQSTATLSGAVSSFGFGGSNAQALLMPGATGSSTVNWAKGKRSKTEAFLPWRRLLNPLLRRDGESDFAVQLDDICHLFSDHEVAGGLSRIYT